MKMRWDTDFLYVAAELEENLPFGHVLPGKVSEDNPTGALRNEAPYADHDFEAFFDVSGTTHFYKEFAIKLLPIRKNSYLSQLS